MSVIETTSRDVSFKLAIFYIILLIDIVLTSFVELNVSQTLNDNFNTTSAIVVFVIQAIAQGVIFAWFFALFWSTVLLKYGLVLLLIRNFIYSILYVLASIILNIAERLIRLVITISNKNETDIWDNVGYRVIYYIRFANLLFFYIVLLSVAKRITRPEYYKPAKWLNK